MNNKYNIDESKINILNRYKEKEMIISYEEICNDFGWKVDRKGSCTKKAQFKTLDCLCEYEKVGKGKGLKYKIISVYDKPKVRKDKRLKDGYNDNLIMDLEFAKNNNGVYAIILDKDIYIGSTISDFKDRYNNSIQNPHSEKHRGLIQRGGKFIRLWVAEKGFDDEDTIRKIEQLYLNYYMNDKNYNVINTRRKTATLYGKCKSMCIEKEEKKKNRKVVIKATESQYDKLMDIIKEMGIEIVS